MPIRTCDRINVRDRMNFYAPGELGRTRSLTPEGYLVCEGVAIARTGVQRYNVTELPLEADGDGNIIVDRLPEEVFRPETIASFEGKSVTVEHPNDFVNPETWKKLTVGHIQNVRRGSGTEADLLLADLVITDASAIAYVNDEMPQLSCGYNSDYEQVEPGRARQRNIIGNHVALVDRGRAGPRCAIKDNSIGDDFMPQAKSRFAAGLLRVLSAFQAKDEDGLAVELKKLEKIETSDDDPDEATGAMDAESKKSLKEVVDWMNDCKAKDAAAEKQKAKDAEDAETERKRKEAEDAKAKDAVLSAEVLPKLVNLGKVYTGDSAQDAPLKDVFSLAEILAPGIVIPTTDSLKSDDKAVPALIVKALETADATPDGKEAIKVFLMGRELKHLTGDALLGVFNGAAALIRQRNNRAALGINPSGGDAKPKTGAEINKANREFWASRSAGK